MNFTLSAIASSLAAYLAPSFPGVTFYEDPNQQGTTTPCFFLQQRDAEIAPQISDRYYRTIRLDLTYLVDYNLPDMQQQYSAAADQLDFLMETFPYSDGTETGLVRTYNRVWRIDLDALHYNFDLQVRVTAPTTPIPMESIQSLTQEAT